MHRNVEENEICIVFDFRLGFIFIDLVISTAKLKRDCLCRTRLRSNGTTTTSLSLYESRWQRTPPPHGGSLISDNSAQYHPHTSGVQSPQSRWTCWHFRTTTITTIAPHPLPPFRLPRQLLSKCSSKLPRFNANNFCVIRWIKARVVVDFHKITGFSENLSAKTDNMFKIPCLPRDPRPLLHFQVKSSSVPKTENAKVKLFNNIIAAVLIWTWACRFF